MDLSAIRVPSWLQLLLHDMQQGLPALLLFYLLGLLTPALMPGWLRARGLRLARSWLGGALAVGLTVVLASTMAGQRHRHYQNRLVVAAETGLSELELATIETNSYAMNGLSGAASLAQVAKTARELDIWQLTNLTARSVEEVASLANITVHGARCVLQILAEAGLMARTDGGRRFVHWWSDAGLRFLLAFAEFTATIEQPMVAHLTESVRTGKPAGLHRRYGNYTSLYHARTEVPELVAWTNFMDATTVVTRAHLLAALGGIYEGVAMLLDVCGNEGINAIALARRYPRLRVTVHDLPAVIADPQRGTTRRVQLAGLEGRVETFPWDLTTPGPVPWPRAVFDLAQLVHCVNEWSLKELRQRLREIFEALLPGGQLLVVGCFPSEGEWSASGVWFVMPYFITATQQGGTLHAMETVEDAILGAGFVGVQKHFLPSYQMALVARKPTAVPSVPS